MLPLIEVNEVRHIAKNIIIGEEFNGRKWTALELIDSGIADMNVLLEYVLDEEHVGHKAIACIAHALALEVLPYFEAVHPSATWLRKSIEATFAWECGIGSEADADKWRYCAATNMQETNNDMGTDYGNRAEHAGYIGMLASSKDVNKARVIVGSVMMRNISAQRNRIIRRILQDEQDFRQ